MRTGAIFARGSCRALKWLALFGVVFALGAGQSTGAETTVDLTGSPDLTNATLTVSVADVDEGGEEKVIVTVSARIPANAENPTTVTVSVGGGPTPLADLAPGVTPAEGGDWIFRNPTSNATGNSSTREFVFPANPTNNSVREILKTGDEGIDEIFLQARNTDSDAENEGVRLTLGVTGGLTNPAAGAATLDVLIDDGQNQEYVFTPMHSMATEGDTAIKVKLTADPPHYEGSTTLTLKHDMPQLVDSFSVAVDPDATSTAAEAADNTAKTVTIGSGLAAGTRPGIVGNSTTSAEITIEAVPNDVNREDETVTLSAYTEVGSGPVRTATIELKDAHKLPTLTATLLDENGMAVTNNMVTEGSNYTLTLARAEAGTEALTVMLETSGTASQLDDYSLPMTPIMIASGETSSAAVSLEVDLDRELDPNESLTIRASVEGDRATFGPPQMGLNPMDLLPLTIMDGTQANVWVADGAEAAIEAAIDAAKGDDQKLSPHDPAIEIAKSALFDSTADYTVRVDADTDNRSVARIADEGDTVTIYTSGVGEEGATMGTATITITGTAVSSATAFVATPVSVDVAEIEFDVTLELTPPGPPRNLAATPGDGRVWLRWDAPNVGDAHSGYEYRVDARDWNKERFGTSPEVGGFWVYDLENGEEYVFELRAINAAGAGDAASVKEAPEATPVAPPDASLLVEVKSVSVDNTTVDESGGLEVTVTTTVPAGEKGADDKIAAIPPKQYVVHWSVDHEDIATNEWAEITTNGDVRVLTSPQVTKEIPRGEKATEFKFTFRLAIGQDLDAEDEKFLVGVSIDGDPKYSDVITIDDAQEQKYELSLPAAAKGAIKEGADAATLTLEAEPEKTFDIPVTLVLDPNDPSKYTLSRPSADEFGRKPITATIAAKADGDREDDTITVSAYTAAAGKLAELEITVTDDHMLPMIEAKVVDDKGKALSPQPESVMEGETVKIMLTAVDEDGKAMKAAEKLSVSLMASGGDAQDYRLSAHPIEIASGKESSAAVNLMITEDQDIGEETLMFDATVSGEAKNGSGTKSVMNILSLMIEDGTMKQVYAKPEKEVQDAIYAAKNAGAGDDMTFTEGEMIELMGNALFDKAEGVSVDYTAMSSDGSVASASVSGGMITVTAEGMGMADITITAVANTSGVKIVDQTDPGRASVMFPVEVGLEALSIALSGPEDMNLVEGMSATVTATANRPVTEAVTVTLMRDRGMSTAGDDDFRAEPITIAAGATSGTTMVMAVEDDMMESMSGKTEELVLYGMTEGMAGEVTGEVKFYIWDAAVPALPIIAQLLLAAFLAVGGYRRYRRR